MTQRKAARVLPEPVGARISVFWPLLMASQPCSWAGVGASKVASNHARAMGEKWDGVTVLTGQTGVPVLPNVLVSLECTAHARHDGGDHEIFVGKVAAISPLHAVVPRPLVFFGGRYAKLSTEAAGPAPPPDALFLHGW